MTWIRNHVASGDLIRLAASLVLALLLWGWVTAQQDPETTRVFPNVAIQVGELPDSLVVVTAVPAAVVTVTGPQSVINELTPADISAQLDLHGITQAGTYSVRVLVSTPDGVWSRKVTPSRLEIVVENTVRRDFVLEPEIVKGAIDPTRRIGRILPETTLVTARGPASLMARVARVVLPIELGGQTRDFTGTFTPVAQDSEGRPIPEIAISPNSVRATVEITARGKSVAVITQLVGTPAQGFDILERTVNPPTVLVDGPQDVLDELVVVRTLPIDVSGATDDISQRIGLELPEGVRVVEPADGLVQVYVQIGQRAVRQPLPGQVVKIVNLAPGLTAEWEPREVTVVVVAAADVLSRLTADDVLIQVDLDGLGPGDYDIQPSVILPPNVQWISTDPSAVHVTIRRVAATTAASPVEGTAMPPGRVAATPVAVEGETRHGSTR